MLLQLVGFTALLVVFGAENIGVALLLLMILLMVAAVGGCMHEEMRG